MSTEGMRSPRGVAEDHTESRARSWLVGGPYFDFPPSPFAGLSTFTPLSLHNCDLPRCRYRKVMKGKHRGEGKILERYPIIRGGNARLSALDVEKY